MFGLQQRPGFSLHRMQVWALFVCYAGPVDGEASEAEGASRISRMAASVGGRLPYRITEGCNRAGPPLRRSCCVRYTIASIPSQYALGSIGNTTRGDRRVWKLQRVVGL